VCQFVQLMCVVDLSKFQLNSDQLIVVVELVMSLIFFNLLMNVLIFDRLTQDKRFGVTGNGVCNYAPNNPVSGHDCSKKPVMPEAMMWFCMFGEPKIKSMHCQPLLCVGG
jgi:hypothetical protein